ncbi:MAG: hypothetical protein A2283_01335 [Lentisphaerae bacterium RIFOXYA12_FULL_48_11]|nr:MAG: hypothetical protein A2283_01335 [Lentisphaerae bacterium RIFOXYA12_FULL_48_11]
MNIRLCTFVSILAFLSIVLKTNAENAIENTRQLAKELATEGKHESAAVEYRRLATMEEQKEARSGYYWAAAHQYLRAGKPKLVEKMLDRSEDNSSAISTEVMLLRAQAAIVESKWNDAEFYLKSIIDPQTNYTEISTKSKTTAKIRTAASKNLAHVFIAERKYDEAEQVLIKAPLPCPEAIGAVNNYRKGHDRRPMIGGLLGLIPGLGYAYSGEYANAARSLILNGLFIYALIDTADDEQWGAFAAVSFFELTWYTGSVYGGIDAAHRFNENRKAECYKIIEKETHFSPDTGKLPLITLNFDF